MNTAASHPIRSMVWPFVIVAGPLYLLYLLVAFVLRTFLRIACAALGLGIMAIGIALSLTIVGAVIGMPLAAFGLLLMARALF